MRNKEHTARLCLEHSIPGDESIWKPMGTAIAPPLQISLDQPSAIVSHPALDPSIDLSVFPSTAKKTAMTRPHGRRQATFSERRAELFRDMAELGVLCGADVAVVVFDPSGRVYALGVRHNLDSYVSAYFDSV
jgi:hypothetical protein